MSTKYIKYYDSMKYNLNKTHRESFYEQLSSMLQIAFFFNCNKLKEVTVTYFTSIFTARLGFYLSTLISLVNFLNISFVLLTPPAETKFLTLYLIIFFTSPITRMKND